MGGSEDVLYTLYNIENTGKNVISIWWTPLLQLHAWSVSTVYITDETIESASKECTYLKKLSSYKIEVNRKVCPTFTTKYCETIQDSKK